MNCYTPELPPPGDPRFALRARMALEQLILLLRGFCRDGQAFVVSNDVTVSGTLTADTVAGVRFVSHWKNGGG